MTEKLLTQAEACERLGIRRHELLSLCAHGKIRYFTSRVGEGGHGRHKSYPESTVEALLEKRQRAAEQVLLLMPAGEQRSA
jgi:predicted site-specific integrase-resolvase